MVKKVVNLTADGKKELEKELKKLIDERPTITEKIATARAFGDLSENEDYSAARNEQKLAESRIAEIEDILKNAKIIHSKKGGTIGLGSKVVVDLSGKKYTYSVVGPVEANPLEGKISNESPIGKALFGRKIGEEYTLPNGNKGKILDIQ